MNSLDKITLKSFLAALIRQNNSLPDALQKQVNKIGKALSSDISQLDALTENYPPLEQEYMDARCALQNDGERFRSSALEENSSIDISDEQLMNLALEVLTAEDSVSFAKKVCTESSEIRQLLSQLLSQTSSYTINILDLIGQYCIATEDGQMVYDLIHPKLLENQPVELDFTGVEIAGPPFLNFAIGQLLRDIQPESIDRLLKVSNLNPLGSRTLKLVIENSKQYYSDPEFRSRVDRVIKEYADSF
jgi:hypothetical protein